jgi:crotonobetainyl-CoA:carnitine CoA-transferase CaiB-like acyl-CoA transferase
VAAGLNSESESASSVLAGVRVVEFSQLIAAPFCGLTLVDLGAEVIKVEPRGGDPLRQFPPYLDDGQSAQFQALNRGKRGVVADLATAAGRELSARLIASADVVVENLGDARRLLGISYEDAAASRPGLVWCAITGWGTERPGRAIDPSLQAAMGLISITGEEGRAPARIPVPLVDFMTGMYAIQRVLVALWRVKAGARGAFLDCAMVDAAATLVSVSALLACGGHLSPRRLGSESPLVVPSGVFVAGDEREVQIVCLTERHWWALCDALGHPEWVDDPRCADNSARLANRELVRSRISEVIAGDSASGWVERISTTGGICEQVRDIEEAWSDGRLVARGLVAEAGTGPPWAARMPLMSLARGGLRPPGALTYAPDLGADTDAVLRELDNRDQARGGAQEQDQGVQPGDVR